MKVKGEPLNMRSCSTNLQMVSIYRKLCFKLIIETIVLKSDQGIVQKMSGIGPVQKFSGMVFEGTFTLTEKDKVHTR